VGIQPLEPKVKGKRITTFIKAFRAACTKAGCPGRIPHDLRRAAVRNLVRAGVPERVAMQMTGHKTRSVFERYNIVSECDLVEAAKKLNVLQPAALPPERGSHTSDHDGLASPERRSREGGHNSDTVEPDRGPRLKVSL
jgi:Phage integrase family